MEFGFAFWGFRFFNIVYCFFGELGFCVLGVVFGIVVYVFLDFVG